MPLMRKAESPALTSHWLLAIDAKSWMLLSMSKVVMRCDSEGLQCHRRWRLAVQSNPTGSNASLGELV